jgi:hypothetical protein
VKIGDLVRKALGSDVRDVAGLGLVIEAFGGGLGGPSYKVQWSSDYGTFWTFGDKLERVKKRKLNV